MNRTTKATHANDKNPKTAQAEESVQTSPQANDGAVATSPGAGLSVVQPTQATPSAPDDFHGQGGLYRMKNGRRVLVNKTQPETAKERK